MEASLTQTEQEAAIAKLREQVGERLRPIFEEHHVPSENEDRLVEQMADLVTIESPDFEPSPKVLAAHLVCTGKRNIPTMAPVLWRGLTEEGCSPLEFVKNHYSQWLGPGQLIRSDFEALDKPLYKAIGSWLGNPNHKMPDDVYLPTLKEHNDWMLSGLGENTIKELASLRSAWQRRIPQNTLAAQEAAI